MRKVHGLIKVSETLPECSEFIISQITDVSDIHETFLVSDKCSDANFRIYKTVYPDYPYTAFGIVK